MSEQKRIDSLTRRQAIAILGATGIITITGCGTDGGLNMGDDGTSACAETPAMTEGPYFVDELLNRSDIRIDPSDGSVAQGTTLRLRLSVSKVQSDGCVPLPGAQIDVWHANAAGRYSDEAANGTAGKKYLRGYQVSDSDGVVEFITIYPGWYSGRTVHIHVKVRSGSDEFNTQLYFNESTTAQVFSGGVYSSRGLPDTSNARDGIYDSDTLLTISPEGEGYLGTAEIKVNFS